MPDASALGSAELQAALAGLGHQTADPVAELDGATWQSRSQRLRGHLATRLEFVIAMACYPGADAPADVLGAAQRQLEERFARVRAIVFELAGIDPDRVELHRSEGFRLARLAAQWTCRLWCVEKSGLASRYPDDTLKSLLKAAMSSGADGFVSFSTELMDLRGALIDASRRVLDVVTRFDFMHANQVALVEMAMKRITEQATFVHKKLQHDDDTAVEQQALLRQCVAASADAYCSAYLRVARKTKEYLLGLAPEEQSAYLYMQERLGGLSMEPVHALHQGMLEHLIDPIMSRAATLALQAGVPPESNLR